MKDKLPTRDKYFAKRPPQYSVMDEWSKPLYACPECGGPVRQLLFVTLTSIPAQYIFRCYDCGFEETHT